VVVGGVVPVVVTVVVPVVVPVVVTVGITLVDEVVEVSPVFGSPHPRRSSGMASAMVFFKVISMGEPGAVTEPSEQTILHTLFLTTTPHRCPDVRILHATPHPGKKMRTLPFVTLLCLSCVTSSTKDTGESGETNSNDTGSLIVEPEVGFLVINEIVAKNNTGLQDDLGSYEDWFEVASVSKETLILDGWTLTDGYPHKEPWPFPIGTTLEPGARLVFIADKDTEEGPLHTDFQLSSSGETLTLVDPEDVVRDQVSWGSAEADESLARLPDLTGEWTVDPTPTPGAPNE
jgi:hypothetical protein